MEEDTQYNGRRQTMQWKKTDNTMEKDRQYNGQKKKDKQWSTKHYTENNRLSLYMKSAQMFVI